jgi:hypothetical protein
VLELLRTSKRRSHHVEDEELTPDNLDSVRPAARTSCVSSGCATNVRAAVVASLQEAEESFLTRCHAEPEIANGSEPADISPPVEVVAAT